MKLARYWTRASGEAVGPDGGRIQVAARGWSNESIEDARRLGREIAGRMASVIARGDTEHKRYLYGQRPLPEPIIREFGKAVVTRNLYGALVLNTPDLMFVDIDRDDPGSGGGAGLVSKVMSLFREPELIPSKPASKVVGEIQRVAESNRLSARVYKTAAGYRAIITSAHYEPGTAQSEALLKQFGSDPLYIRLCKMQESFRARLSPKPWRCGQKVPPVTFPFTTPKEESEFQEWEQSYSSAALQYATCRYVTTIGGSSIDFGFQDLIHYHDQETKANSSLPLA